jgi:hypothetical protein
MSDVTMVARTVYNRLTPPRMDPYLKVAPDLDEALRLYIWNARVAASFLATLGHVEVLVRNALDKALREWTGKSGAASVDWLEIIDVDPRAKTELSKAQSRVRASKSPSPRHDKVIAELNFGFWRYLVARRYLTKLWIPALHVAFPHGDADLRQRQREVELHMGQLNVLRNRVAHHEPIFHQNLGDALTSVQELSAWVCPVTASWILDHSDVPQMVHNKPRCLLRGDDRPRADDPHGSRQQPESHRVSNK